MTTRVVNRRVEDFDVYIGRGSKWGNPYSHQDGTKALFKVASRDEAIRNYRTWILSKPELLAALPELRGKRLGCYCKPSPCHGDVLVELLLEMEAGLRPWTALPRPDVVVVDIPRVPVVLPVRYNPDLILLTPPKIELVPPLPGDDNLDMSTIRFMLDGLIKRDCEAPSKEEWDRWAATPEGKAEIERRRVAQARRANNELRMLTLSERHADDDGFSLKMIECDRAQTRALIADGWNFDEATTAWANEGE